MLFFHSNYLINAIKNALKRSDNRAQTGMNKLHIPQPLLRAEKFLFIVPMPHWLYYCEKH